MHDLRTLTGCGTALITPFTDDGAVDRAALAAHVAWQIEEGVDFLVPCGTTGETPTLSLEEKLAVVSTTVAAAGGRRPVVAGAGGNDTRGVIDLARRYAELGVDGLLSVTPYYNKPTQEGLYRHYRALAEAVSLPIILYNVPGRTGTNLLPATVARLAADCPSVVGIKEASGSIVQITDVALSTPPGFRLLSGDDGIILPLVAVGGCGVISVASNVAPRLMSDFVRACVEERLADARARLEPVQRLFRACFVETNPIPAKAALAMMGRIREVYRLPLSPLAAESRERLAALLEEAGVLPAAATA